MVAGFRKNKKCMNEANDGMIERGNIGVKKIFDFLRDMVKF